MIYTLTLNPSVDYFIKLDKFVPGKLNRTSESEMRPGGKGINVSRVLKRLGVESRALGFLGGFTGEFIRTELLSEGISVDFTEIEGNTRINVKLTAQEETEINGSMPPVAENEMDELFSVLDQLKEGDVLVLAGSVPSSIPPDIYNRIISRLRKIDVKVVVDTSGKALKEAVEMAPFFIKPNQHELGGFFGVDIRTPDEAVRYGKQLLDYGISHVVISLGGEGALYLNKQKVIQANVPKGEVRNAVGSGDSLVAGFLAGLSKGMDEAEAFRQGVACGTATAFSEGLCDRESVQAILSEIDCHVLEGKA